MNWLSELDVFTIGLIFIQYLGEHTEYTSRKLIVFRIITCVVIVTVFTFIVSNLGDPKSSEFVTALENFTSVFHTLFKYLMLMYNKNDLNDLMNTKAKHFWKVPYENKKLSNNIRNIYTGVNILQIAMVADIVPLFEIYCLGPYLNPNNPFVFASNVFVNSIIMDAVVLFCQYYVMAIIGFVVFGYDFMYLSLCTDLRVQVKILKYKLKEVFSKTSEDAVFGVSTCVKQHNFLLSIHAKMQKMYSTTLLFHYFVSLVTVCFDIYLSFVAPGTLSHEILKLISLACVVGQFAFYCVPAELLSSEFSDIAQALYMSKWYENKSHIQKLMLPIMVKCQKLHYFSAAGLLDINIEAFGSVVRKAFSFCAVIRNVLDK